MKSLGSLGSYSSFFYAVHVSSCSICNLYFILLMYFLVSGQLGANTFSSRHHPCCQRVKSVEPTWSLLAKDFPQSI